MLARAASRLGFLCAVLCAAAAMTACGASKSHPLAKAPNVLVIVTDDQRSDQMDVMPTVRREFESGGTKFTHAFAQSPQCCPSRASIFSGRLTHNHHVVANTPRSVSKFDQEATIERYLQKAGYQTAIVGKYFNAWDPKRAPVGFDRWAIMHKTYENVPFQIKGQPLKRISKYSTDFIGDQAVGILRDFQRDRDHPWFLYLAPIAPHFPYTPAPRDAKADVGTQPTTPAVAERDLSDKPAYIRTYPHVEFFGSHNHVWQLQRRTLLAADRMIARVLAQARRDGRSTLMIFISDNGYLLGEHGVSEAKRLPYPESAQVPMYMRWPGHVRAGAVDDRPVLNADIAPTIADAVGLHPPTAPPFDGRSLLSPHRRHGVLLEQYPEGEGDEPGPDEPKSRPNPSWVSLWTPRAQYTEWYRSDNRTIVSRELYDVRRDPWQLHNLLAKPGARPGFDVAGMARDLARARTCRGTSGPRACP